MKLKFWCKYIYENCILLGIVSNVTNKHPNITIHQKKKPHTQQPQNNKKPLQKTPNKKKPYNHHYI